MITILVGGILIVVFCIINALALANFKPEKEIIDDGYHETERLSKPKMTLFTVAIWIALAIGLMGGFTAYSNISVRASLTNFYHNNVGLYQITADKTASYLSVESFTQQLVAGSIEKMQLTNVVSQRLAEWRDQVAAYNNGLAIYEAWQDNLFVGVFYPRLPTDLRPLQIQQ